VNKLEALDIVNILKVVSKERKQARIKLCRFIRENVDNCCQEFDWLKRKSDRRHLGDLSDSELEYYTELMCKNLED